MVNHAREYLNILLYQKKSGEAARLAADCYKHNEVIRPADPDNFYTLAYALKDIRAFKECMALINNFHTQHPNHPDIPKLYLLGARVLSEELNNDAMAKKILQFLKAKYSQHNLAAEIDQFYNIVKSVASG
jgi:outer membrane protein assembly factor BamD (BamD/ComL family)